MLFAIGAGDMVVATTHECDYPPQATSLPRVTSNALDHDGASPATIDRHIKRALHNGSSIYHLDEQLLRKLRPDLIVTQELCEVCAVSYGQVQRAVRTLAGDTPVLSLEPRSLDDILATALVLGEATGCGEGAGDLVRSLRRRIEAVDRATSRRDDERPRVVCIEWTDPLMVGGHWIPEMVGRAGGCDVLGTAREASQYVEWTTVCEADSNAMVLMPCGYDLEATCAVADEVIGRPGFDQLTCARDGRVVAVDGSAYFNRPGPRIVDGLEILAQVLAMDPGTTLRAGARWLQVPTSISAHDN
jgi:iron complex transport system substrate-binding protein